jgi:abhydrolase domain-containing protein 12
MALSASGRAILAICLLLGIPITIYILFLVLLIIKPSLQTHAIYLHKLKLVWARDLYQPERFGFAPHQVNPFYIAKSQGGRLQAWHILHVGIYLANQESLLSEPNQRRSSDRPETALSFRLLSQDPEAILVIYLHGAAGTIASPRRIASYRAIGAADPDRAHILTFDYRGFGNSPGWPDQEGLVLDATAVVEWAVHTAKIPAERVILFGQSLGSAVALHLYEVLALQNTPRPVKVAGLVLVSPFTSTSAAATHYRIAGCMPTLRPVSWCGPLFRCLARRVVCRWDNMECIINLVRNAGEYNITFIHADDDGRVPVEHTEQLFRTAVGAALEDDILSQAALDKLMRDSRIGYGEGGWIATVKTAKGPIRMEIPKHGGHDEVMSQAAATIAVRRVMASLN